MRALERLVYVPEGDWESPTNYSGTPRWLGAALRDACVAVGLGFEVVDTSFFVNTEIVWELARAALRGAADDQTWAALSPAQRRDESVLRLTRRLAAAGGNADAVCAAALGYLAEAGERVAALLAARHLDETSALLALNTLNPPVAWPRTHYYLDTPLIPFYFGDDGVLAKEPRLQPLADRYAALERAALAGAGAIFCFNRLAQARLVAAHPATSSIASVVGAGANLDELPPFVPRRFVPPLKLLYVGLDFPIKGGPLLVAAARQLDPALAQLTIVTRAEHHPRTAVAPNVRFLAPLPKPALCTLYATHDVFVFPSERDAHGLAVAEAMHFGLPVIAPRAGALGELIGAENGPAWMETATPAALVAAVGRLASDPAALEALSRHHHLRARRLWCWSRVAASIVETMLQARLRSAS